MRRRTSHVGAGLVCCADVGSVKGPWNSVTSRTAGSGTPAPTNGTRWAYHRDGHHRWTANDINDLDALGSTLPYCDVVITDKAAAEHATRTGLAGRLSTAVLHRLDDLLPLLSVPSR